MLQDAEALAAVGVPRRRDRPPLRFALALALLLAAAALRASYALFDSNGDACLRLLAVLIGLVSALGAALGCCVMAETAAAAAGWRAPPAEGD